MPPKRSIALVTGGYSSESAISYLSAKTVWQHLDKTKFQVFEIHITPKEWTAFVEGQPYAIDKSDFSIYLHGTKHYFDLCYMLIHGTPGEDGILQGYFESIGQAYLSCSASVSALTFNKFHTNSVLNALGIHTAKAFLLFKHQDFSLKKLIPQLRFPVFVKPNNGGSSIGMSKVKKSSELEAAITLAFKEDTQVIIEEQITGREFTVGVCRLKNELFTLPITEIETKNEFFDYEAKYHGKAIETTPAKINAHIKKKIESLAKEVYNKLNCTHLVRIDLIYDDKKDLPYVLEINTIPGQTSSSFIPQQVLSMKMSLKKFYTLLIEEYYVKRSKK